MRYVWLREGNHCFPTNPNVPLPPRMASQHLGTTVKTKLIFYRYSGVSDMKILTRSKMILSSNFGMSTRDTGFWHVLTMPLNAGAWTPYGFPFSGEYIYIYTFSSKWMVLNIPYGSKNPQLSFCQRRKERKASQAAGMLRPCATRQDLAEWQQLQPEHTAKNPKSPISAI